MGVFRTKVATQVSPEDMRVALGAAWQALWNETPSTRSTLLLAAHYSLESGGGRSCMNYNIGNKKAKPDGGWGDFTFFTTWELVDESQAARDEAVNSDAAPCRRVSTNPNGTVKMVYSPNHPACCFRAYDSLDSGVADYLTGLKKRFSLAWDQVIAGDPVAFSHALKVQHYYTALESEYRLGMVSRFYGLAGEGRMTTDQQIKDAVAYLGFDSITSFQAFTGLTSDGKAGPITRGALALAVDEKAAS